MISFDFLTVESVARAGLGVLSVGTLLAFARFVLGPSIPDRVVALDTIATLLVGALVLHGIANTQPDSLRVATVLALTNFLGTIAFSVHIRRSPSQAAPEESTSR